MMVMMMRSLSKAERSYIVFSSKDAKFMKKREERL